MDKQTSSEYWAQMDILHFALICLLFMHHNILSGIFFHSKTEGKLYFTHFNVNLSPFFREFRCKTAGLHYAVPNRETPADTLTLNRGAPLQQRDRTGSSLGRCSRATEQGRRHSRTESGAVISDRSVFSLSDLHPLSVQTECYSSAIFSPF